MSAPLLDEDEPTVAETELELAETRREFLSWKRIAIQLAGFMVGAGLIAWLLWRATRNPHIWEQLRNADPLLVAAMLACSALSLLLNGTIFWVAVQPVQRLGFAELQWINGLASLLNYAPIRLGIVARLVWHLRVDHMRLRKVVAWFASITFTVVLPLTAAVSGALLARRLDWIFVLVVAAIVIAGGLAAPRLARMDFVARRAKGVERVVTDPRALWGSLLLRLADVCLWSARMMLAVRILGMDLTLHQSFMLAMANLAITLNPIGRVGFREMVVTLVAAYFTGGDNADLIDRTSQLAVAESASELMISLPAGILCIVMLRRRWLAAKLPSSPSPAS